MNDNRSAVLRDSVAVAGSAGLFRRLFVDLDGTAFEDGYDSGDAPSFSRNGVIARRVTSRNSPSVINSVFNVRNFWDGRASSIFNGLTPFGDSDIRSSAMALTDGGMTPERVHLNDSSLASQAVGPALNDVEMSYQGRTWPKLAKKMLGQRPLAMQRVSPEDSVLGEYADPSGRGLQTGYLDLIQAAFQPKYWNSPKLADGQYTLAEYNFALFWGLAIQAYEATLVSDDAPFDRFSEGAGALTAEQQEGLRVFRGPVGCANNCHIGPEFTAAGVSTIRAQGAIQNRGNGLQRPRVLPYRRTPGGRGCRPGSRWAAIPAVGRNGHAAPLQTFDELLLGIGNDGSRSHTLTDACSVP